MTFDGVSLLFGVAILIYVCYQDFREEVFKPDAKLSYYLCMILFVSANVAFYLLLVHSLTPIDILNLSGVAVGKDDTAKLQPLLPVVLAILYSASGVAEIPIGDKKISVYRWLLGRLSRPFRLSLHQRAEILSRIEAASKEKESLDKAMAVVKSYQWSLGEAKDRAFQDYQRTVQTHIEGLEELESAVAEGSSPGDLIRAVGQARGSLQDSLNEKLRRYIRDVVTKNLKHSSELGPLYKAIGVVDEVENQRPPNPTDIVSMAVVSIIGGLLFALILQLAPGRQPPIAPGVMVIISMIAIGCFLVVLSLGARFKPLQELRTKTMKYKRQCFGCLFVSGGLAGLIGYLVLRASVDFVGFDESMGMVEKGLQAVGGAFSAELVKGVLFGAATGTLLFCLDYLLELWPITRRSHVARVLSALLVGFVGYSLFDVLMILLGLSTLQELMVSGPIGAIVLPTSAFLIGLLFYKTRGRASDDPPSLPGVMDDRG